MSKNRKLPKVFWILMGASLIVAMALFVGILKEKYPDIFNRLSSNKERTGPETKSRYLEKPDNKLPDKKSKISRLCSLKSQGQLQFGDLKPSSQQLLVWGNFGGEMSLWTYSENDLALLQHQLVFDNQWKLSTSLARRKDILCPPSGDRYCLNSSGIKSELKSSKVVAFGSSNLIWNLQWGRRNSFLILDLGHSGSPKMGGAKTESLMRTDSSVGIASEQGRSEAARVLSFIGECGEDFGAKSKFGIVTDQVEKIVYLNPDRGTVGTFDLRKARGLPSERYVPKQADLIQVISDEGVQGFKCKDSGHTGFEDISVLGEEVLLTGEKGFSKQFWIGERKVGSLLETQALLSSENFDSRIERMDLVAKRIYMVFLRSLLSSTGKAIIFSLDPDDKRPKSLLELKDKENPRVIQGSSGKREVMILESEKTSSGLIRISRIDLEKMQDQIILEEGGDRPARLIWQNLGGSSYLLIWQGESQKDFEYRTYDCSDSE
ncbi:MAG: hypothetical protein IPJ71_06585 [Bdellovibrionales bacterium]|nr:hypothetical protein [Bdellovibrionales bacterium]